jgi:hypothetical protein
MNQQKHFLEKIEIPNHETTIKMFDLFKFSSIIIYILFYSFLSPIKSASNFILDTNDNLSTSLAYLDKKYFTSIWRSSEEISTKRCKHIKTVGFLK